MQAQIARHFASLSDDPLRGAFSSRRAVMPFRGRRRIEPDLVPARWAEAMATPADKAAERLAYVHVPFCANHCLFCGFYRNAYTPAAAGDYVDLVIRDLEREAESPALRSGTVGAVYLGGGTPSALTAEELSRLLLALRRHLPLAADCEITVEGRIIHFDAEKIDACLAAGANRFSIGVQSFDTEVRRRQGRRAARDEAVRFLEGVKARGGAALVIDLMYGLPGQTMAVWQRDLETAVELAPDGIDLYGLNLIPGTPLFTAMEAGKFAAAPTLADLGGYYSTGSAVLNGLSWRQVSNNHWARTPLERNRYNRLIKEGADCLAYGSGAGGSLGEVSYGLSGDLSAFADAVAAGKKPIGMMMASDSLRGFRNLITGSLEQGRFDPVAFDRFAGRDDLSAKLRPLFEQWQAAGLVELDDDGASLTTAGRFWYANLVSALYDIAEAEFLPRSSAA